MNESIWLSETITPNVRVSYEAQQVLHREKTAHQQLTLIENRPFGHVLMLEGATQVTTADEFCYHEMFAHVPILAHGRVRDVLIVGGRDCGLAEEVLKHGSVRTLTQVEIDEAVISVSRKHLGSINAPVFRDPRFRLEIGDGLRFVRTTGQSFDVVLVDSTDPVGPGRDLFTQEFYRSVRERLRPDGVLVTQSGMPFLQSASFSASMSALRTTFSLVACYLVAVPSYFGGHLALGWASNTLSPTAASPEMLAQRAARTPLQARYYTPEVHVAAFALPRYVLDLLRC